MDNIREKLVELLNGVQHYGAICTMSQMDDRYASITQVSNTEVAERLIAHGVTVQEWIPASEPPKEDGRYNVYIADKVHACVDAVRFYKDGVGSLHKNVWARYDCEDGYYEVKHITHWMPLPTPPKGE